jgi:hypothetical protein
VGYTSYQTDAYLIGDSKSSTRHHRYNGTDIPQRGYRGKEYSSCRFGHHTMQKGVAQIRHEKMTHPGIWNGYRCKVGFSKTRGWVFGYKLHMSCSTGRLAVPLTADLTTANIYDPHMYDVLVEPLQV